MYFEAWESENRLMLKLKLNAWYADGDDEIDDEIRWMGGRGCAGWYRHVWYIVM